MVCIGRMLLSALRAGGAAMRRRWRRCRRPRPSPLHGLTFPTRRRGRGAFQRTRVREGQSGSRLQRGVSPAGCGGHRLHLRPEAARHSRRSVGAGDPGAVRGRQRRHPSHAAAGRLSQGRAARRVSRWRDARGRTRLLCAAFAVDAHGRRARRAISCVGGWNDKFVKFRITGATAVATPRRSGSCRRGSICCWPLDDFARRLHFVSHVVAAPRSATTGRARRGRRRVRPAHRPSRR